MTSIPRRDKTLSFVALGRARLSTIVHYESRNLDYLRAGSRRGKGGLVTHHGTVGYCDGLHADGAHRWVATGGLPIEFLVETVPDIDPGAYRTDDGALIHVRPATIPIDRMAPTRA